MREFGLSAIVAAFNNASTFQFGAPIPEIPDATPYCLSFGDDQQVTSECLSAMRASYAFAKALWPRLANWQAEYCIRQITEAGDGHLVSPEEQQRYAPNLYLAECAAMFFYEAH